jgi:lipopolysaccharide biosynthesis protein
MEKTLVLYVFHTINDRVRKFIVETIFYDENIDFIVISNSKTNKINVPSYVKTLFRDNIGFDFGGWSDALLIDDLYKKYDKFIFINSSVAGPFLRPDFKGKWTDIYLNGLQDNIKLFGSTINAGQSSCKNDAHVQSYIFSMDKETLEYLIGCGIFSTEYYVKTMHEAIFNREIEMSRKIIQNGWNIGSLLPNYKGLDFSFSNKNPEDYNIDWLSDCMHISLRGYKWSEYDLVFIKGNRCECI